VEDRGGKGTQEMGLERLVGEAVKYGDILMAFERFFVGVEPSGGPKSPFFDGLDWAGLGKPVVLLRSLRVDGAREFECFKRDFDCWIRGGEGRRAAAVAMDKDRSSSSDSALHCADTSSTAAIRLTVSLDFETLRAYSEG